jgi:hypothetical protein
MWHNGQPFPCCCNRARRSPNELRVRLTRREHPARLSCGLSRSSRRRQVTDAAFGLPSINAAAPRLAQIARCLFAAVSAAAAVREPTPVAATAPATFAECDRKKLFAERRRSFVGHEGKTDKRPRQVRPKLAHNSGRTNPRRATARGGTAFIFLPGRRRQVRSGGAGSARASVRYEVRERRASSVNRAERRSSKQPPLTASRAART